jgi:hypothetical protein
MTPPEETIDRAERKRRQRAEKEERKRQRQAEKDERSRQQTEERDLQRRQQTFNAAWQEFWASPGGQARHAFSDGDHVFQCSFDVVNQQAIIVAMVGSTTQKRQADPTAILNTVCREGWELVNGDFVFVMHGQQSRDKFLASGQNVAVAGTVMGYYLFRRCEQNRKPESEEQLRSRLGGEGLEPPQLE